MAACERGFAAFDSRVQYFKEHGRMPVEPKPEIQVALKGRHGRWKLFNVSPVQFERMGSAPVQA